MYVCACVASRAIYSMVAIFYSFNKIPFQIHVK
jgi:hypothetical protein